MRLPVSPHALEEMGPRSLTLDAALPEPRGSVEPSSLEAARSVRFRRVFDEHFPFVWRTLRRLGVTQASLPDASQRVFWAAARRIEDIPDERARGFLFGTARRVAADFRRLGQRIVSTPDDELVVDVATPSAEELLDQKRARELLDELLDALDDDLREMLVLQEGEGMSLSEIAELLEIPLGTAASRLRRAREEFRRRLKRCMARKSSGGAQ